MNTSTVQEISGYLKHQDYSLAVRRTLDTCLDTGDDELIKEAIQWSGTYNRRKEEKELPLYFIERAKEILSRAGNVHGDKSVEKIPLLKAGNISKHYRKGNLA